MHCENHDFLNSPSGTHHMQYPSCSFPTQSFNCALPFEGGGPGVEHQPDNIDGLVDVWLRSEECLDSQMLEYGVTL